MGDGNMAIRPYDSNPRYWQYKGVPVLLLGATNDDNLFQMDGLEQHLEELHAVGGNYIRNTMSSRDSGNVWPHRIREDGMYDLNRWNPNYWEKFENLLRWTSELDIIVQIEVWDRFDYSREPWQKNPFNPANNINYTVEEVGMETDYPRHPSSDIQPFFHAIPGMPLYGKGSELVRQYQEMLVQKMLDHSFKYDHVLYCMNNETSSPVEWGKYWIRFIRNRAAAEGKAVYLTDMYDHFFRPASCQRCQKLIAAPGFYSFMDISQINSRNFDQAHWDTLQWIMDKREEYALRPVNCTKVYGGNLSGWGSGTNADGVERFLRDVIGGCAAVRHHRPPSGNGLNDKAKACIRAVRLAEDLVPLWDLQVDMDLIGMRDPDEAYVAVAAGHRYFVYFPQAGSVELYMAENTPDMAVQWIDVAAGMLSDKNTIDPTRPVILEAPDTTGYLAVIVPAR
jgi:hypothetical protein